MYTYLFGAGLLGGVIWLLLFAARKDLRRAMLWSAGLYIAVLSVAFILLYLVPIQPAFRINPGYWTPPTLFDLNNKTGGYAIEDAVFMFFAAGIAAATYETLTKRRIVRAYDKKLKRKYLLPFAVGLLAASGLCLLFGLNLMYCLILFQVFGGLTVLYDRRDLAKQAIYSGLFLMAIYGLLFIIFNLMFPRFIAEYYRLEHTTRIILLGVPLEEYLYALTLGFMWAPLYEYEHQVRDRRMAKTKPRAHSRKRVVA